LPEKLINECQAEAEKDGPRGRAAFFADDQHLRAGRSFGIFQRAVLLDDERPPERNHHQDAEQSAEHGDDHDAADVHFEAEQHERRHGDTDAKRDRFAAEPVVCTMLFSRMVVLRKPKTELRPRNSVIERTATGIDAETVKPTFKTR